MSVPASTTTTTVVNNKDEKLTWGQWMKTPTGMITIAVLVLLIVGGGWYWYSQKDKDVISITTETSSPALPTTTGGARGRKTNITRGTRGGGLY